MYDAATDFTPVATRSHAGCWSMEDRCRKSLINWPYQLKHSPRDNLCKVSELKYNSCSGHDGAICWNIVLITFRS